MWDVSLQHCSQTLIGFKDEVWSLDCDPQEQRLVAGCTDSELRVYAIRHPDEQAGTVGDDVVGSTLHRHVGYGLHNLISCC